MKQALIGLLLPVVRLYFRYVPIQTLKAQLWERVRWRSHEFVARTRFGARMAGNTRDLIQGRIYYFGVWEPHLTAFIADRLRGHHDRTFIDVGANIGYFSLLAARQLRHGRVVAIEAFPSTFQKLLLNIRMNGLENIRALQTAASDGDCDVNLFYSGAQNEGATTSIPGQFPGDPVAVPGAPLHKLLDDEEIRSIRLVKIDVEGAEHAVMQGMLPILDKLPHDAEIVMEISPSRLGESRARRIFDQFANAGFFPYALRNKYDASDYMHKEPGSVGRLMAPPMHQTDVVFSRIDTEVLYAESD